ncbi:rhamnulokinase [Rhodopirellula maiorica SM1]|uniref:Rhamnulokinase n=1 Tax=Rhodopirellula maiorica SM1 TaxID=1265738 RepID=M5RUK1_9BACT|nr:rhamnulokinase family protein [Rhodopirellula maiorica]EMI22856.1 rhamnulokinase [Rhodopirellula maiorica SM1]
MEKHYIACDLGAESGRVILGTLRDGRLTLEEIHRFANGATKIQNSLRWNIIRIFDELKQGLRMVADRGVAASGMSVDSWGVDYVLLNDRQPMLGLPYQYRDARTEPTYAAALENPGRETIFAETGIQFMAINTLYHLIADVKENSDLLQIADQFLNIADYLNFLFCGVGRAEVSLASTTQLYNPTTGQWSAELIRQFALPEKIFPPIVASGTRLGPLLSELCDETGLPAVEVIATCSHDTGAAVAAVPAEGDDWAYLSSGTWSLIGVELPDPRINNDVLAENFTNEAGLNGTTRFLKNIVGLWLLQESRRSWSRQGQTLDYAEINQLAEQAEPFRSLINPDDPRFMSPADMPTAIDSYCQETNQPIPETPGQYARCILESLALLYGRTLDTVQRLTGRQISKLHIVGGGSQSTLLNQLAANATGRTVYAGPVEATAIGNVLIQAMAMGDLESLSELRRVVRDSFSIATYEPESSELWEQTRQRFTELVRGGK